MLDVHAKYTVGRVSVFIFEAACRTHFLLGSATGGGETGLIGVEVSEHPLRLRQQDTEQPPSVVAGQAFEIRTSGQLGTFACLRARIQSTASPALVDAYRSGERD